jgi:hypothetical protein
MNTATARRQGAAGADKTRGSRCDGRHRASHTHGAMHTRREHGVVHRALNRLPRHQAILASPVFVRPVGRWTFEPTHENIPVGSMGRLGRPDDG